MKSNVGDVRRTHGKVTYRNGERADSTIQGDSRVVTVALESGEVDDLTSISLRYLSGRSGEKLFRPERVELRWQRGNHWAFGSWGNQTWKSEHTDTWVLDEAVIRGTNVRKDGSLGKQTGAAIHRWEGHTNAEIDQFPAWFVKLIEEHDPAVHGSPLDNE